MKMKKLAAFVSLLLCVCLLPASLFSVCAEPEADATPEQVDLSAVADGGSWVNPADNKTYTVVKTADTLQAKVKANAAGNYILGADIDFSSKETLTNRMFGNVEFTGILDGNGYSIVGVTANYSAVGVAGLLFSTVDGPAIIRNLMLGSPEKHISFTLNGNVPNWVGCIAAKCSNGTPEFNNITVYADILFDGTHDAPDIGGLVGKTCGAIYTNCTFNGSISVTQAVAQKACYVGGIVGRQQDFAKGALKFENCHNNATINTSARTISGSGAVHTYVGGILGGTNDDIQVGLTFRNCSNSGAIIGDEFCGGIFGGVRVSANTESTLAFDSCANSGNVQGNIFAGGIIGAVISRGDSTNSTYRASLTGCVNTGNVSAVTTDENYLGENNGAKSAAGGIVGKAMSGYWTLTDCCSTGDISCNAHIGSANSTACGIIGNLKVNSSATDLSTFTRCYATGTLKFSDSSYKGNALFTVNSPKVSFGYLPKVTDCYWALALETGSWNGITTNDSNGKQMITADSSNFGEVTAEDVASGRLAYLLGKTYGQVLGTDASPIPGSPAKVAFDGEKYLNTDAEHLLGLAPYFAYVQKSNDNTRVRVILVGPEGEELTAAQELKVTFTASNGSVIKVFGVTGDKLEQFVCVEALGELYYAENGTNLFGVIIKNIPASVFSDGSVTIAVEFNGQRGSTEI